MNKKVFLKLLLLTTLSSIAIASFPFVRSVSFGSKPWALPVASVPTAPPSHIGTAPGHYGSSEVTASEQNNAVEVEVIKAMPNGFEPASITRARGPFVLAIHNQSGTASLTVRLTRAQGEQMQEMRLRTGSRRHHQRLDLPAGDYIISEAGHPEWSCQVTITR